MAFAIELKRAGKYIADTLERTVIDKDEVDKLLALLQTMENI